MKRGWVLACAVGVLAGVLTAGCGSSRPIVSVTITQPTSAQTIQVDGTMNITAVVTSSSTTSNLNVNWSLSGSGCGSGACGTLSNQSGTSVTYEAPPSVSANTTVSVIATSIADPSKSASINITVLALSVQIRNQVTEVAAVSETNSFGHSFTAVVQSDPTDEGVSWTLTANGVACSPACGTLSLANPYAVQYTPPSSVPAAPNNAPTITATSISNPAVSDADRFTIFDGATACSTGGNENLLEGEYAIMLRGWSGSNGTSLPILYAASFRADGTGKITGGVDQFDPFVVMSYAGAEIYPSASSYSVGPDNRGCLVLTDFSNTTFTLQFSLGAVSGGVASKGDIILYNKQSATPMNAAGILRLQDPSAFSLSALAPNYAFGVDGWDNSSGSLTHVAMTGIFAQSGGSMSNAAFDENDGGKLLTSGLQEENFGSIQAPVSTATGTAMATLQIEEPYLMASGEVYIINSSELFFVGYNLGDEFSGRAVAAPSSYSTSAPAPSYILHLTGNSGGAASASIGQASLTAGTGGVSGTVSGKMYEYTQAAGTTQNLSGSYAFTSLAGRLAITGSDQATSPVCYMTNPFDGVSAFCISTDSTASLGVMDTQPAATYDNSSVSGNFFFGSAEPGDDTVPDVSGVASISSGNLTGTEDASSTSGLSLGAAIIAALSINADGTGTMGPNTVLVTNGTELYFIDEANGAPAAVQVFQP